MPVWTDDYGIKPSKAAKCKAGHFMTCSKKPNCGSCALRKCQSEQKGKNYDL